MISLEGFEAKIKQQKRELSRLESQMKHLVDVIADTGDPSLVESLQEKRKVKTQLENDVKNEEKTLKTSKLPVEQLTAAMDRAREMLRSGELVQTRQLITLYVRRVIVQEKTVEVYLNPIPTMSYLTNLEEFMTKFLEDESYSNLERIEVWRETLNAKGKQMQI